MLVIGSDSATMSSDLGFMGLDPVIMWAKLLTIRSVLLAPGQSCWPLTLNL